MGVAGLSVADSNFVQSEHVGELTGTKNEGMGSDVYFAHGEQAYAQLALAVTRNGNRCAQHNLTLCLGEGQMKEMLKRIVWSLREEVMVMSPYVECLSPQHMIIMNIIIWNYRGALKPSFQIHV